MNPNNPLLPPLNGWETAELSTLQDGLKLSFRERLLWLQDMMEFADRFAGAASGRKLDREGNIIPVIMSSKRSPAESPVVRRPVVSP